MPNYHDSITEFKSNASELEDEFIKINENEMCRETTLKGTENLFMQTKENGFKETKENIFKKTIENTKESVSRDENIKEDILKINTEDIFKRIKDDIFKKTLSTISRETNNGTREEIYMGSKDSIFNEIKDNGLKETRNEIYNTQEEENYESEDAFSNTKEELYNATKEKIGIGEELKEYEYTTMTKENIGSGKEIDKITEVEFDHETDREIDSNYRVNENKTVYSIPSSLESRHSENKSIINIYNDPEVMRQQWSQFLNQYYKTYGFYPPPPMFQTSNIDSQPKVNTMDERNDSIQLEFNDHKSNHSKRNKNTNSKHSYFV